MLKPFDRERIEQSENVCCAVDGAFRLRYANPAWFAFARNNGAGPDFTERWGVGSCIMDAVPEVLQKFYRSHLNEAIQSGRVWEHLYECSSAGVYREFQMRAAPLACSSGLLLVHSLVVARAHDREPSEPDPAVYFNEHNLVVQCCHCRRIRRSQNGLLERWDWIPAWVEHPPERVTHTLCPICLDYYYPRHAA